MSKTKLTVTNFSNRTGSPFKPKENEEKIVHEEILHKTEHDKQKEKQSELLMKVNKKTAEYQAHKPSSGFFTEVVTHGAFKNGKDDKKPPTTLSSNTSSTAIKTNGVNTKSLLGFPSSANDLALEAKTDLESDKNISKEVKDKVIEKLFKLASMCQHIYESKVRIMTDFEKYKDTHMKNETRREKEHAEQLYKLNMNFQNEVVQAIQRLKSEMDISRNVSRSVQESSKRDNSIDFNTNVSENEEIKDHSIEQDAISG